MKKTIIIISSILGILCLIGIGSYIVIKQVNEKIVMVSNIVEETTIEESTVIETMTVEESTVEEATVEESSVVVESTTEVENTESDVSNEYYTKDDNGNISVSEDFYSSLQAYSFFEGATVTEVNDYLTENEYLLAPLDPLVNDTAWFKEVMDMQGENGDKLHEEEVVTTKPAEKPAQQTQQPVQQEPVQQPAQPSQQEPVVQEPAPTLTPEEAAAVAENDAWVKEQMEKSAAIDRNDPSRYSGIDHGDYTSY